MHARIWLARQCFIGWAVFFLGYVAIRYQDMNRINNELLREIQLHIRELHAMETAKQIQLHAPFIAKPQRTLSEGGQMRGIVDAR